MENTNAPGADGPDEDVLQTRGDQSVREFLDDLNLRVRKDPPCPVCGRTEWLAFSGRLAMPVVGIDPEKGGIVGALHTASLYCVNCRFIRSHLMTTDLPKADV